MTSRLNAKYPNRLRREVNRARNLVSTISTDLDTLELTVASLVTGMTIDYTSYALTADDSETVDDPTAKGQVFMRNVNTITGGAYKLTVTFTTDAIKNDGTDIDHIELVTAGGFFLAISNQKSGAWRWQHIAALHINYY